MSFNEGISDGKMNNLKCPNEICKAQLCGHTDVDQSTPNDVCTTPSGSNDPTSRIPRVRPGANVVEALRA